ncbi:dihydroorotate oxidase [Tieghemostelium lacteum]|uniref:Dihydroorotate oxidase n=1 Tax=Tieghemostelium lacteum TaxID=361077 RepID=A0A151ZRR8_TIELA|nr:dihydroorotate oxidase [Tieghemostelium lacteum]|eukprot:KYQ96721.1 dihydroorotate oxidase [Tieghemostelium lacteum]
MSNTDLKWFPEKSSIYDISKSWLENLEQGPFIDGWKPVSRQKVDKEKWIEFIPGIKLQSPLGVPAGPLLNSTWVKFALDAGFDLPTYKTIRSKKHLGHPVPNVLYLDGVGERQFSKSDSGGYIHSTKKTPSGMTDLAITNSFGMPSMDKEYLKEDITKANGYCQDGQAMIVSIVGTACDAHDFVQDFIDTAMVAVEAGSKIIEVNYSCPNVVTGEGQIYHNPQAVYEISSALVKTLQPYNIPLFIKVGIMEDQEKMNALIQKTTEAGVTGISGINTLSMKVTDKQSGLPSLGENRLSSGVCGAPIRDVALDWVKSARSIIDKQNSPLKLIGCGGIVEPQHFNQFLDAGADIAMSATGLMFDPYLALKWHNKLY